MYWDKFNARLVPADEMPRECYFAGKIDGYDFVRNSVWPRMDIPAEFMKEYVEGYVDALKEQLH